MIIVGCFLIGIRIVKCMNERLKQLHMIKLIINFLEGEIVYRHLPLEEAFLWVSNRSDKPFDIWLINMRKNLIKMEGENFIEIWGNNIFFLKDNTFLTKEDIYIIDELGKSLGYLDIEMQKRGLEMTRKNIDYIIDQSKSLIKAKIKTTMTLTSLGGILMVVLLL